MAATLLTTPEMDAEKFNEVRDHVHNAIRNAVVTADPSPYFYIESVFPEWFYKRLLQALPRDEAYSASSKARTGNPRAYKSRVRFKLEPEYISQFEAEQSEVLQTVERILNVPEFFQLVMEKFIPFLDQRPDLTPDKYFEVRSELMRDTTEYGIGPHTDAPHKAVTLLFYLPPDDDLLEFGTSFYEPKQPGYTDWRGTFHSYEPFTRVKTFEFKPNTVLGFLKTDHSWHGVEVIDRSNIQRDILHWVSMVRNK